MSEVVKIDCGRGERFRDKKSAFDGTQGLESLLLGSGRPEGDANQDVFESSRQTVKHLKTISTG